MEIHFSRLGLVILSAGRALIGSCMVNLSSRMGQVCVLSKANDHEQKLPYKRMLRKIEVPEN